MGMGFGSSYGAFYQASQAQHLKHRLTNLTLATGDKT